MPASAPPRARHAAAPAAGRSRSIPMRSPRTRRGGPRHARRDCSPTFGARPTRCPIGATCSISAPTAISFAVAALRGDRCAARSRCCRPRRRRTSSRRCASSRPDAYFVSRRSGAAGRPAALRAAGGRMRKPAGLRRPADRRRPGRRVRLHVRIHRRAATATSRRGAAWRRTCAASRARFGVGPGHTILGTVPPQHMYGFESTVLLPLPAARRSPPSAPTIRPTSTRRSERCRAAHALHHALPPARLDGKRRIASASRRSSRPRRRCPCALAREGRGAHRRAALRDLRLHRGGAGRHAPHDAVARVAGARRAAPLDTTGRPGDGRPAATSSGPRRCMDIIEVAGRRHALPAARPHRRPGEHRGQAQLASATSTTSSCAIPGVRRRRLLPARRGRRQTASTRLMAFVVAPGAHAGAGHRGAARAHRCRVPAAAAGAWSSAFRAVSPASCRARRCARWPRNAREAMNVAPRCDPALRGTTPAYAAIFPAVRLAGRGVLAEIDARTAVAASDWTIVSAKFLSPRRARRWR